MAPFSMKCTACNHYIYKGTKFNAKKEATGTKYLDSIPIYRFTIRCPGCMANLSFITDPGNADYTVDQGCQRSYEPWRQEQQLAAERKAKRLAEEQADPLKALENKAADSKRQMRAIEELHALGQQSALREQLAQQQTQQEQQQQDIEYNDRSDALMKKTVYYPISNNNNRQSMVGIAKKRTSIKEKAMKLGIKRLN